MSPGDRAFLRLGGRPATAFEVGLSRTQRGSETTLSLRTGGETLEREVYETSATAFGASDVADNIFVPSLDLVRFPAREGDGWDWRGRVVYAGAARPARARVGLAWEGEELYSEVRLFVQTDSGRPEVERRLGFWFRPGRGVVRRAFGDVSSRGPVEEGWRP